MKWDIQAVGFTAKQDLLNTTKEKVLNLDKYYHGMVGAEIYLKLEYSDQKENKRVEIKLNIPGDDIHAGHQSNSFEHSLNECIDKLKRQLTKKKELERAIR